MYPACVVTTRWPSPATSVRLLSLGLEVTEGKLCAVVLVLVVAAPHAVPDPDPVDPAGPIPFPRLELLLGAGGRASSGVSSLSSSLLSSTSGGSRMREVTASRGSRMCCTLTGSSSKVTMRVE